MGKKLIYLTLLAAMLLALCAFAAAEDEHAHNWGPYTVIDEPTCTATGREIRICTICGESEIETLAMIDHDFGDWTYYSDDYHSRTCSVCGYTERQSHDTAIAKTVTSALNNRLGRKNITCAACGYNYTRLVSAYDRYYSMEGTDILDNDTSYVKVNTTSIPMGSEKQLALYSNGVFDIYASGNITVETYANTSSGEYRGIKLTGGSAVLSVSGENADLEFIQLAGGTKLSIEFKNGASSLSVSSCETDLVYIKLTAFGGGKTRVTISKSELKGSTLNISMRSYSASSVKIDWTNDDISVSGGELLNNASWSYNTRSHTVTSSADGGRLTIMSGGTTLLNGASDGTLSESAVTWGFRCVYKATGGDFDYETATYSLEGALLELPVTSASEPAQSEGTQATPTPTPQPQAAAPEYLSASAELSETYGTSPKIEVSYSQGTYTVRVSSIPNGYTLSSIQFIQSFNGGAMTIKNAFTAEASFPVQNLNGKITVNVTFKDSKGNENTVNAGSFEYRAE